MRNARWQPWSWPCLGVKARREQSFVAAAHQVADEDSEADGKRRQNLQQKAWLKAFVARY